MNNEDFSQIAKAVMNKCGNTLIKKGKEYAGADEDRLSAFKRPAACLGTSPEQVALSYAWKHWDSINQLVKRGEFDPEIWDEKCGDLINYMILIRALVAERQSAKPEAATAQQPAKAQPGQQKSA